MSNRHHEPGWRRIGRIDSDGRRSLWIRETTDCIELCAGREGDDAYVRIDASNPQWRELEDVLSRARYAAENEDADGMTLEREAKERGEPSDLDEHPELTLGDSVQRDPEVARKRNTSPTEVGTIVEIRTDSPLPYVVRWPDNTRTAYAAHELVPTP